MPITDVLKNPFFQLGSILVSVAIAAVSLLLFVDGRYILRSEIRKEIASIKTEILDTRADIINQIVDDLKIKGKLSPYEQVKLDHMKDELKLINRKLANYERSMNMVSMEVKNTAKSSMAIVGKPKEVPLEAAEAIK